MKSNKVIDCFLFFQELDLLEMRFRYLNEVVDQFIVVEACQTFTGSSKRFVFEENKERFAKYAEKIVYYKIEESFDDWPSIMRCLEKRHDVTSQIVSEIMQNHNHYDKGILHWVLDTYHRECIRYPLDANANDDDLVLLSDLDEIPTRNSVNFLKRQRQKDLKVFQQQEFKYYLNCKSSDEWFGTIGGRYDQFGRHSLNVLRLDSKAARLMMSESPLENGGYHFTSVGSIDMIKNKIKSWAHQEYNNPITMSRLNSQIKRGKDIFNRDASHSLVTVSINDSNVFDPALGKIMQEFSHLVNDIEYVQNDNASIYDLLAKLFQSIYRVCYEVKLRVNK